MVLLRRQGQLSDVSACRVIAASAAALGCWAAGTASGKPLEDRLPIPGMCDASAAAPLGTSLFVAASDEDNILRVYHRNQAGPPTQTFNLNDFLKPQKNDRKSTSREQRRSVTSCIGFRRTAGTTEVRSVEPGAVFCHAIQAGRPAREHGVRRPTISNASGRPARSSSARKIRLRSRRGARAQIAGGLSISRAWQLLPMAPF